MLSHPDGTFCYLRLKGLASGFSALPAYRPTNGHLLPIWELDKAGKKDDITPRLGIQMRLIGRERLDVLKGTSTQVETWLRSWVAEVRAAHWKKPADVRHQFPRSQQQSDSSFIFPVGDCDCEICVLIAFPQEVAVITDLKNDK